MDELTVGRVLFAGSDANVHLKKKSEGEGEGGQSPLKGGSKHKVDKHASEDVATADADAGSPAVRHSRKGLGAFSLSPLSRLPPLSSCLLTRACRAKRSCFFHLHNHNKTHTRSETHHRCCLALSCLVWSRLVLSCLVLSCLVLSVQAQAPESPILTMKHGFHIVKKSSDPSGTQIKVRKTPLFEPFLY